jgi:RNA polymerase sigma factor (sigma-70 family)
MNQEYFNPCVYKKVFPLVKHYVLKNSGTYSDFEDILQDGLIIFFQNLQSKNFVLTTYPEYYIYKICTKLWLKELEKRKKARNPIYFNLLSSNTSDFTEQDYLRREKLISIIENNLKLLSEKCQMVFQLKKDGFTTEQIAEKMGFKNQQISKDKTFRCKKRLIDLISKDQNYVLLMKNER